MELKDFSALVKAAVEQIAPDVMEDINDHTDDCPGWDGHAAELYKSGFSVIDAIKYTRLMSQTLNEDMALRQMNAIRAKYDESKQ